MHAEFVGAIERDHHGKREHAADLAAEARARPDFAQA
jgi:hypothetical protein